MAERNAMSTYFVQVGNTLLLIYKIQLLLQAVIKRKMKTREKIIIQMKWLHFLYTIMVALSHICVMVTVLFSPSENLSTTKSVSSCWFNSLECVLNWHLEWHRIKAFWNLIEIQLNKASLCDKSVWSVSSLCKLLFNSNWQSIE